MADCKCPGESDSISKRFLALKCYYDQKYEFFFSPYFENISTYYLPCKVLSQNSYGKSDYFNCNFRIRLAAITQFKNDRDDLGRVGPERK